jgi:selenocysteine lyase/cysteine desulfurase
VDASELRAQFPVLDRVAYLNAGTDGPLPAVAAQAAAQELSREAQGGRTLAHFERRGELGHALRDAYAALLGCAADDLSLTTCTSEGLSLVIDGLRLGAGDEILTSDEEHPGLLGALIAARELRAVTIRTASWAEMAGAVGPRTRLIACSHVSWMTGAVAPAALAEVGVPVLLDGAQGVGAIPTDVRALGCAAYAGPGQKWLCGPDGTGMLYTTPELRERLAVTRRGYANLADPNVGLEASLHADARRLDTLSLNAETVACALAAYRVLVGFGWDALHERAALLAAALADRLVGYGREVVGYRPEVVRHGREVVGYRPEVVRHGREVVGRRTGRGHPSHTAASEADGGSGGHPLDSHRGTLVTFASPDPLAERQRLAANGVLLRDIPGRPWLRASVGAWNDEDDIARLVEALRE